MIAPVFCTGAIFGFATSFFSIRGSCAFAMCSVVPCKSRFSRKAQTAVHNNLCRAPKNMRFSALTIAPELINFLSKLIVKIGVALNLTVAIEGTTQHSNAHHT